MQDSPLTLRAKLFRGLGDPSRLAIVEALRSGEKTVSELVTVTTLSQPNVSAHLSCLKDCGLLASRQEGRNVFYALADPLMETLFEAAERLLFRVTERITRCSNYQCQTANKCVRNKECASSDSVGGARRRTIKIPLAEGKV